MMPEMKIEKARSFNTLLDAERIQKVAENTILAGQAELRFR